MDADGEILTPKSDDVAEDATKQSLLRVRHVIPQLSLQLDRNNLFVCLSDHNLPHPLPHPPLEGEEISKLPVPSVSSRTDLKGEGIFKLALCRGLINRNAPAKRGASKPN
jgi:hypothetical protein